MTDREPERSPLPDPLQDTLDAYKHEYRDLTETWRHLDGKAQGAVATAGIFLAAAFAFVRSFSEGQIPSGSRSALVAVSLLLVVSVVLAVLSLRIREVAAAPVALQSQWHGLGVLVAVPMARPPELRRGPGGRPAPLAMRCCR